MIKVRDAARNRWPGIFSALNIPVGNGKHCACPVCGGKDRFRFDDREGRGTWFCSHCTTKGQPVDGLALVMRVFDLPFADAARRVEAVLGTAPLTVQPLNPEADRERDRERCRILWEGSRPIQPGDGAHRYLTGRGLTPNPALRYHPAAPVDGRTFEAMLAPVSGPDGSVVSIHRTFLKDGLKAPIADPRRLMSGRLPEGACIRLFPVQKTIGVAEGIETALAASQLFQMPVWSCINAGLMEKWIAPEGVEEVVIFGDNDANYVGQSAAYNLARRLVAMKLRVHVMLPKAKDWAEGLEPETDDVLEEV